MSGKGSKTTRRATSTPANTISDVQETPSQEPQTQERRYGTRKSTQERRPAVEAGLAKRSKADIQAGAAKKLQDKQGRAAQLAEEKAASKAGVKRIAALQDKRVRDEAVARKKMLDVPVQDREGDVDVNDKNGATHQAGNSPRAHAARAHAAVQRSARSSPYLDIDADAVQHSAGTPPQDALILFKPAKDLNEDAQLDGSELDKDDQDDADELQDEDLEHVVEDVPQDEYDGSFEEDYDDQAYQYAKRVLPSDEDTSGEDDGMDVEVSDKGESMTDTVSDAEIQRPKRQIARAKTTEKRQPPSAMAKAASKKRATAVPAPVPKKGLSEKERKMRRIQSLQNEVDTQRETTAVVATKRPSANSLHQPSVKKTRVTGDALRADYRKTMREKAVVKTPTRSKLADKSDRDDDSDVSGNFNLAFDVDISHASSRPATISRYGDHTSRTVQTSSERASPTLDFGHSPRGDMTSQHVSRRHDGMATFDSGDDSDARRDIHVRRTSHTSTKTPARGHNALIKMVPDAIIEGDVVARPAKKRAPKSQVSTAMSRGVSGLPEWVQDTVLASIVPSMIKHYGAHEVTPWDLDHASGKHFIKILKSVVNSVHPGEGDALIRSDKLYKFVRQRVYDWRKGFQVHAITIVGESVKKRLAEEGGGRTAVRAWVSDALAAGGEATYAFPNIKHPKEASGVLQSCYIVKLLAYHLRSTEGAVQREGYPVNAFALAGIALRRAFKMYATGAFVAMTEDFGEESVGKLTIKAKAGSVKNLCEHRHRVDAVLENAWGLVPQSEASGGAAGTQDDEDAFDACDRSSSPVRA